MRIHVDFETKADHGALLYGSGGTLSILTSQILVTVKINVKAWSATSDSCMVAASGAP
jgi:hypothetical protein